MRCSEPGGASRLQSLPPVRRVAELGSLGRFTRHAHLVFCSIRHRGVRVYGLVDLDRVCSGIHPSNLPLISRVSFAHLGHRRPRVTHPRHGRSSTVAWHRDCPKGGDVVFSASHTGACVGRSLVLLMDTMTPFLKPRPNHALQRTRRERRGCNRRFPCAGPLSLGR